MSRYDQDNVEHLDLPDAETTEAEYYTKDAEIVDRSDYSNMDNKPHICAKKVQHKETGDVSYFILCDSNIHMYDPRNKEKRYLTHGVWKFRRVSPECFDTYIRFLKNKYTSFLRQAQRLM